MIYVSALLYFLAVSFTIGAYRSGSKEMRILAFALFAAALGTSLISFFAISTINSV